MYMELRVRDFSEEQIGGSQMIISLRVNIFREEKNYEITENTQVSIPFQRCYIRL